ncbi:MAG: NAD kinase [Phyllobacterium sp.]
MIKKISFVASQTAEAQEALVDLSLRYGNHEPAEAEVIVVLGGDGTMLEVLHEHIGSGKPIYGMNRGSVGFLMNEYTPEELEQRIAVAHAEQIRPLSMTTESDQNGTVTALAINEVSLLRQSHQGAKIRISVDGLVRLEELICDGVMVATPAGSTAYNLSAQGPILPIDAPLLALTPVSPFRPRRWRGALLPNNVTVRFDILESEKRPVNAFADNIEVKSVRSVIIREAPEATATVLFDENHSWDERILTEQFRY